MTSVPTAAPRSIGPIRVPDDDVAAATWTWATRNLPDYLLAHSVRAYCWGATLAELEGITFDATILWVAALYHDVGLTRIPRNRACFEFAGADIARRGLRRIGLEADRAETAARAIELHMAPGVTLADGPESYLLDVATAIDVRGVRVDDMATTRAAVTAAFPRQRFDRLFVAAVSREVERRTDCQSNRLLRTAGLAEAMRRSPWAREAI